MFTSLFTFLGSTAFRWLLGEAMTVWKAKKEHEQELAMLRVQHDQDRDRHQWQQEAVKAQAEAGVRVIEAKSTAAQENFAAQAFNTAMEGLNAAMRRDDWVGKWNAAIRPALATVGILALVGNSVWPTQVAISSMFAEIIAAVLGLFCGGRISRTGR